MSSQVRLQLLLLILRMMLPSLRTFQLKEVPPQHLLLQNKKLNKKHLSKKSQDHALPKWKDLNQNQFNQDLEESSHHHQLRKLHKKVELIYLVYRDQDLTIEYLRLTLMLPNHSNKKNQKLLLPKRLIFKFHLLDSMMICNCQTLERSLQID